MITVNPMKVLRQNGDENTEAVKVFFDQSLAVAVEEAEILIRYDLVRQLEQFDVAELIEGVLVSSFVVATNGDEMRILDYQVDTTGLIDLKSNSLEEALSSAVVHRTINTTQHSVMQVTPVHHNAGNTYAVKEKKKDAMISFRCDMSVKNAAVRMAQAEGMKLQDFLTKLIEDRLNESQ